MDLHCRTAAVIHLDRLKKNYENIRARLAPGVEVMAVLKGDAYGHGISGIYPALRDMGIHRFAAAVWEEGMALRQAGCSDPILLLGDTMDECLPELIKWNLTPTLFSVDTAEKLNALAKEAGVIHPIHIKLDTGMNRIGLPADERCYEPIETIARMENLSIEGMFTHFARADEPDGKSALGQYERFLTTVEALKARDIKIPLLHAANSPATLLRPEVQLQAVRVGDLLFGLAAVDEPLWTESGLSDVMTWHTRVAMVKTIPAGSEIGYGATFVTERETRLATLPVGFADGYPRRLSNRGYVIIHGQKAPIRGRVCMDQMMVDVTDIPGVQRGDTVTLLGDGLSILTMADMLETCADEVVCAISRRVPRLYTTD